MPYHWDTPRPPIQLMPYGIRGERVSMPNLGGRSGSGLQELPHYPGMTPILVLGNDTKEPPGDGMDWTHSHGVEPGGCGGIPWHIRKSAPLLCLAKRHASNFVQKVPLIAFVCALVCNTSVRLPIVVTVWPFICYCQHLNELLGGGLRLVGNIVLLQRLVKILLSRAQVSL